MQLSTIFLNAFLATKFAESFVVSPSSDFTSLSPDLSPQPLLRESPSILDHLRQKLTPHVALSGRSLRNAARDGDNNSNNGDDNNSDYQSAYAEAQALGLHGGFRPTPTTPTQRRRVRIAHGTLMALSFTLWLPLGALAMRTTRRVRLHAALQGAAYAHALAGLALGVWLGRNVRYLDYAHTVIGMAVVAALLLQAALGWWAHRGHVAWARARAEKEGVLAAPPAETAGSGGGADAGRGLEWRRWGLGRGFVHRWFGRCLIALGIINGGLGLKLAQNTRAGEIAYGIVAGIVGTVYLSLLLFSAWRRFRVAKEEPVAPQGGMLT